LFKTLFFGFCPEDLPSEKSAQSIVISLGYLRKQSLFFSFIIFRWICFS